MFADIHRESIEGRVRERGPLEVLSILADILAELQTEVDIGTGWQYQGLAIELRGMILARQHTALHSGANSRRLLTPVELYAKGAA